MFADEGHWKNDYPDEMDSEEEEGAESGEDRYRGRDYDLGRLCTFSALDC